MKNYIPEDNPLYREKRWMFKRKSILLRDKYTDQVRYRMYGERIDADIVHHILPINDYPEYKYESWNLIAVSRATHNKLHKSNGDLTELGEAVVDMFVPDSVKKEIYG